MESELLPQGSCTMEQQALLMRERIYPLNAFVVDRIALFIARIARAKRIPSWIVITVLMIVGILVAVPASIAGVQCGLPIRIVLAADVLFSLATIISLSIIQIAFPIYVDNIKHVLAMLCAPRDFEPLEKWTLAFSWRKQIRMGLFVATLGVASTELISWYLGASHEFLMLAPPTVLYCGFFIGANVELALIFPGIASALSRCEVQVNPIDPSRTPGVRNLASMFGVFTLMLTVSGLLLMMPLLYIVSHYYALWQLRTIIGVWLCLWALVIYFFSFSQYYLSVVVRREKKKILNELQVKLQDAYRNLDISKEQSVNIMKDLGDLYNAIRGSRNMPLDVEIIAQYASSLLISLIPFLIEILR
jgi:hypothetical protein